MRVAEAQDTNFYAFCRASNPVELPLLASLQPITDADNSITVKSIRIIARFALFHSNVSAPRCTIRVVLFASIRLRGDALENKRAHHGILSQSALPNKKTL